MPNYIAEYVADWLLAYGEGEQWAGPDFLSPRREAHPTALSHYLRAASTLWAAGASRRAQVERAKQLIKLCRSSSTRARHAAKLPAASAHAAAAEAEAAKAADAAKAAAEAQAEAVSSEAEAAAAGGGDVDDAGAASAEGGAAGGGATTTAAAARPAPPHHECWGYPYNWPEAKVKRSPESTSDTVTREGPRVAGGEAFWFHDGHRNFLRQPEAHVGFSGVTGLVGLGLIDGLALLEDALQRLHQKETKTLEDLEFGAVAAWVKELIAHAAHWLVDECEHRRVVAQPGRPRVFFSPCAAMKHEVYWSSAFAGAFLYRAGKLCGEEQWMTLGASALNLVADLHRTREVGARGGGVRRGGVIYAKEHREVEAEMGLCVEALAIYCKANPADEQALEGVRDMSDWMWHNLFDEQGQAFSDERCVQTAGLGHHATGMIANVLVFQLTQDFMFLARARTIASYMITNLWDPKRRVFRYKHSRATQIGEPRGQFSCDEAAAANAFAALAEVEAAERKLYPTLSL